MAPLIQADALAKAFGGKQLFDGGVVVVEPGDRIAVVGPNGAGKSTLLSILAGRLRPDDGVIHYAEGFRAQWFDQNATFAADATVRDLLAAPRPVPPKLAEEQAALEARIADPALYESGDYQVVLERFAEVQQEVKRAATPPADAWDTPVARALGYQEGTLDRKAASLSGGERTRVFLARTLGAAKPGDLVVLDEPTNHLDVDAIEWLEHWVARFDGTVMVVSHDRMFLDHVADRVFEVARGRITAFKGDYSDYEEQRAAEDARVRRELQRAQEQLGRVEGTIQQFRHQKRFDGQYGSRMKMVERYRQALDRVEDPIVDRRGFDLRLKALAKASNEVVTFHGATKRFGDRTVFADLDLEVAKGDRIGLVGPNGAGKSTLLRALVGQTQLDAGTIRAAPGVQGAYLGQDADGLDETATVREVLEQLGIEEVLQMKALLGRFRLDPDEALVRKVGTYSGGERQRLAILHAVLKPSNLLVIDEPTNHLDLESREVVAKALQSYPGTLLLVSHDRFLLDVVTDKTAVLRRGHLHVFPGPYSVTREHHRPQGLAAGARRERYVVRKKFTDWGSDTRHTVDSFVDLTRDEIQHNHSLRNAVKLGWLERVDG